MGITAERQQRGVRRRERQRRRRQRRSTIAGPLSAFSFPFSSRSPLVALSSQCPVQFSVWLKMRNVTVIDSGERFSIALVLSTNKNKKIKKYCCICFEIV